MEQIDRDIINCLQDDFPLCERPFAALAGPLELEENELLERVEALLDNGALSRFGPLFNIEMLGGVYCLVAMRVAEPALEETVAIINSFPEVAHNYEREHEFNIWYVLAAESWSRIARVLDEIEQQTGFPTFAMPKLDEYYVGLRFDA